MPPGTVVFTGNQKVSRPQLTRLVYDEATAEETIIPPEVSFELKEAMPAQKITWYDVRGLHDTALIEQFGHAFHMHALVQEDIVNTHQVPKFEEYEGGFFIIIRALVFVPASCSIQVEQVAIYAGKDFVLTFQEDEEDLFATMRTRLQLPQARVRKRGSDYLAYVLMDLIVDNYFLLLDDIGDEIEKLELNLIAQPEESDKPKMYQLKRELLTIRKSVSPLREAVNQMLKAENPLIAEQNHIFFRDLHDHLTQVLEMIENYREMVTSLQDLYLSEISYRMNNVVKVLTIISTIFIPLTFVVGVYGMNFDVMPELRWKYGYFVCLAVMAAVASSLLLLFKKRGWI